MTWVKKIELGDFLEAVKIASGPVYAAADSSVELLKPSSALVSTEPLEKNTLGKNDLEKHTISDAQKHHLDILFSKINQDFEALLREVHAQVPDIVIKLVKKVLGSYEIDAQNMHKLIQDALKEVSEDNAYVEVFISPKDWEVLSLEDEAWASEYPRVSFFKDDKLKRGDCMLKSRFGLIDGRMEKKISKIEKELALR